MASLALLVSILLFGVLLSGPIVYCLSKIKIIPHIIIFLLSIITIMIGLWWLFIVPTPIRFIGLFSAYLGWLAIQNSRNRT